MEPVNRRRFLQGSVLGVAATPLASNAALAGNERAAEPAITGGRLVSASRGVLEIDDGGRRHEIRAGEDTSVWKGGESLLSALSSGDDLMVRWIPEEGLALRVWSNLVRVEGEVVRTGRKGHVLRSARPHRPHRDIPMEIAGGALFGDYTTHGEAGRNALRRGMFVDAIGEAVTGGGVRATLLYTYDPETDTTRAEPTPDPAPTPGVLASYNGTATWFHCGNGAGRCGTCRTSRADQAAWPAMDTCGCCGSRCCDCSRGCKNQTYLRCGGSASVRSSCNGRTRTVVIADCGPCQRANCSGCSPDLCGRGCGDCAGHRGVVIDLTRPTFAAFGYDPASRGCFSVTVNVGGGTGTRRWPLFRRGSRGESVRTIQYLLRARGYSLAVDGIFGPETESRVRAFQRSRGLSVDGIVGNNTWEALVVTVRNGNTGPAVRGAQRQLRSKGYSIAVDGIFGPNTERAVRDFQSRNGLSVDGIVGPNTWCELVGGTVG